MRVRPLEPHAARLLKAPGASGIGAVWIALCLILLNAGCSVMQYKPRDHTGAGFREWKEGGRSWHVMFRGTELYSAAKVRDFAWLRAAEVAHREGARYFMVLSEVDISRSYTRRFTSMTQASSGIGGGTPRGPASVPNAPSPTPPPASSRSNSTTMVEPGYDLIVQLLDQIPEGMSAEQVHESAPFIAAMRRKHGIS